MKPLLNISQLENTPDLVWIQRPSRDMKKSLVYFLLSSANIIHNTETDAAGLMENFGVRVVRATPPKQQPKTVTTTPHDNPEGTHYCLIGPTLGLEASKSLFEDILGAASHFTEESGVSTQPAIKKRGPEFLEEKFERNFRKKYETSLADFRATLLEKMGLDALQEKTELNTIRRNLQALQHIDLTDRLSKDDEKKLKNSLFWTCVKNPDNVISAEQFYKTVLATPISPTSRKDRRNVLEVLATANLFSVNIGVSPGVSFHTYATHTPEIEAPTMAQPPAKEDKTKEPSASSPYPLATPNVVRPVAEKNGGARTAKDIKLRIPKPARYTQAHLQKVLQDPQFDTIFILGPSGTAKTGQALADALQGVKDGRFDTVTMVRGLQDQERLGYLPGDEQSKLETTFRQLDGNIGFLTEGTETRKDLERKNVMRAVIPDFTMGETLSRYVIVDDAQMLSESDLEKVRNRKVKEEGQQSRIIYTADLSPDQMDVAELIKRKSFPGIFPLVAEFAEAVLNAPKSAMAQRTAFVCFGPDDIMRNDTSADEVKMRDHKRSLRNALAATFLDQQTLEYRERLQDISKYFQAMALEADWRLRSDSKIRQQVERAFKGHLRTLDEWGDVEKNLQGPFKCPEDLVVDNPFPDLR